MAPADPRWIVSSLLGWYARRARDLPWRREPTPYRVLLSELMLQQTRVDTVIPYFERFVARWPTLEMLAAAEEEELLHAWAGLGYYRRARNLHRCARAAVERGGLPSEPDALRELPGIGPYTAGAVASIAFGVPAPLVDGNVERVVSRLDGRSADPREGPGKKALWARCQGLIEALEEGEAPGDLNQALMELGATVCSPRDPSCLVCPVRDGCVALAEGRPEAYPVLPSRKKPVPIFAAHALVRVNGALVLGRRPPGLLGGLWEPIGGGHEPQEEPSQAVRRVLRERVGLQLSDVQPLGTVTHVFSHRKLTATVFAAEATGTPSARDWYREVRAVPEPGELPLSKLARKLLAREQSRG